MSGFKLLVSALSIVAVVVISMTAPQNMAGDAESGALIEQLDQDLRDTKLDRFSLFEAALIAGGLSDPNEVNQAVHGFDQTIRDTCRPISHAKNDRQRLVVMLDCLHQRFLTGEYRADYSELHRTLAEGHFNCVTSTILFRSLCQRFDLRTEIVASKEHVLCRLPGERDCYIETTCREWHQTDIARQYDRLKDAVSLDSLRELSDVELLGKVYYNLGVSALESRDFTVAVRLLRTARKLDQGDIAARDNLLAALNNWALSECDAGRYEAASQLIHEGVALDPTYPPLNANDLHVHQQWIKNLCRDHRFSQAIDVLDGVVRRRADVEVFRQGRQVILGLWAQSQFTSGELAAGWRTLDEARKNLTVESTNSHPRNDDLEVAAVLAAHDELLRQRKTSLAKSLIDQALARNPRNTSLLARKRDLPMPGL